MWRIIRHCSKLFHGCLLRSRFPCNLLSNTTPLIAAQVITKFIFAYKIHSVRIRFSDLAKCHNTFHTIGIRFLHILLSSGCQCDIFLKSDTRSLEQAIRLIYNDRCTILIVQTQCDRIILVTGILENKITFLHNFRCQLLTLGIISTAPRCIIWQCIQSTGTHDIVKQLINTVASWKNTCRVFSFPYHRLWVYWCCLDRDSLKGCWRKDHSQRQHTADHTLHNLV